MKNLALILATITMLSITACSAERGKEQMDTALFEEKQNNRAHAISLYEEVVRKYPDSPHAKTAAERLAILKSGK